LAPSTTSGTLADWFGASVTVVGPTGSLRAFFEDPLINDTSFAYPLLYDALLEQILDTSPFFPGYAFQLVN
jgi:hypothetical protein